MATAKQTKSKAGAIIVRIVLFAALATGLVAFFYGKAIAGFSQAGTGYAAKTACSCRYIAGRDMDSCYDDFLPGMWAIWLTEDEDAQSVTATVPLIKSTTATYRDGPGCVLEPWDG